MRTSIIPGKYPFRITLVLCVVLIITVTNIIRLVTSIAWHDTLNAYISPLGILYIAVSGAVWTGVGLFILASFGLGAHWTRPVLLISTSAYAAWVWADNLFVQAQLGANWPFSLVVTILLLAYMFAIVLDPHNNTYFMKRGL